MKLAATYRCASCAQQREDVCYCPDLGGELLCSRCARWAMAAQQVDRESRRVSWLRAALAYAAVVAALWCGWLLAGCAGPVELERAAERAAYIRAIEAQPCRYTWSAAAADEAAWLGLEEETEEIEQ